MVSEQYFMAFGVLIAVGGFALARNAQGGDGKTIVKIFGQEITLAAAGGILVIFLGAVVFSLPSILPAKDIPGRKGENELVESPSDGTGNESDAVVSTGMVSPTPTSEPTGSVFYGTRRAGVGDGRRVDGWLEDRPDYWFKIQTDIVRYDKPIKPEDCLTLIKTAYENKGVKVDWSDNMELFFGQEDALIDVWCAKEGAFYAVTAKSTEYYKKSLEVRNIIKAALGASGTA